MKSMKQLFEDKFEERVNQTYAEFLDHMTVGPGNFDRDALQLGVIFEMGNYKKFHKALKQAMLNLEADPHFYDDVTGYGKREKQDRGVQSVLMSHPGLQSGIY